jgi:pyrroloquinoline quinone biosynthesis protein B
MQVKRTIRIIFLMFLLSPILSWSAENDPYIYILGVVQDAGFPQTGCYEVHCLPAWENTDLRRGATSIALVDPRSNRKFIFEATPHFPQQFYSLHIEAPDSRYNLEGIFLTHAHIGHYTGLMFLGHEAMGAESVPVYAMPRMHEYLSNNGPWSQLVKFNNIDLILLENGKIRKFDELSISPFLVPHRDEYSETVGYRIQGPTKSALFIPDIDKWLDWDINIIELLRTTDYALIDASFFADGELGMRDMSQIPHPFVTESMKLFDDLSEVEKNKVWFIHMNHTNPLLDPNSEESKQVLRAGFNIATEGIRLPL